MRKPLWVAAAVLLLALVPAAQEGGSPSASTGPGCRPVPTSFGVPEGSFASRFRVVSLRPGAPCSPNGPGPIEGFSIRRGSLTVFVCYKEASGRVVEDPLPLARLELPAGSYALYAAPAAGASVTLAYALQPAR